MRGCLLRLKGSLFERGDPPRPRIRPEQFDARRTFRIVYETAFGRTARVIRVRHVSRNAAGVPVIKAFCFLRQGERHFRADRIVALARFDDDAPIEDAVAFYARWGCL